MTPQEFKKIRTGLGFSQSLMAEHIGCTLRTVQNYEHAKSPIPKTVAYYIQNHKDFQLKANCV